MNTATQTTTQTTDTVLQSTLEYITTKKALIPDEHVQHYSAIFVRRWKASYVLAQMEAHSVHMLVRDGIQYAPIFRSHLSMDVLKRQVAADKHDELELFLHFRRPHMASPHADHTPRVLVSIPFASKCAISAAHK